MKHVRTFESKSSKSLPDVGDYVVMKSQWDEDEYDNFINNNVGQVISYRNEEETVMVKYENVPNNILLFFPKIKTNNYTTSAHFVIDDIVTFSKSKEELELFIQANKYNI